MNPRAVAAGVCVVGTDTGVGKTLVACALLRRLRREGARALAMKPVAAGARQDRDGRHSDDARALRAASGIEVPDELMNPYLFAAPISPHLAARHEGVEIDLEVIARRFGELAALGDAVVVEGAGGFCVPLTDRLTGADLAQALGLPLMLVVGLRLGCLNHALLTAEAIAARGLEFAGWVANTVDPEMAALHENVETLRTRLAAPCLGVLPWLPVADAEAAAERIAIPPALAARLPSASPR